jgi:hypothetical protein
MYAAVQSLSLEGDDYKAGWTARCFFQGAAAKLSAALSQQASRHLFDNLITHVTHREKSVQV